MTNLCPRILSLGVSSLELSEKLIVFTEPVVKKKFFNLKVKIFMCEIEYNCT